MQPVRISPIPAVAGHELPAHDGGFQKICETQTPDCMQGRQFTEAVARCGRTLNTKVVDNRQHHRTYRPDGWLGNVGGR